MSVLTFKEELVCDLINISVITNIEQLAQSTVEEHRFGRGNNFGQKKVRHMFLKKFKNAW